MSLPTFPTRGEYEQEVERLETEIQRLRDALEALEEVCPECDGRGCNWCADSGFVCRPFDEMRKIRAAALAREDT